MKQKTQPQTRTVSYEKIHQAIKNCCDTPTTPMDKTIRAFRRLIKQDSAHTIDGRKIDFHKGEYVFLLTKQVSRMQPEDMRHTGSLVQLTDWLLSKAQSTDISYKRRIQGLIALMGFKKVPIPQNSQQSWAIALKSKTKPSIPLILPDPDFLYSAPTLTQLRKRPPKDY